MVRVVRKKTATVDRRKKTQPKDVELRKAESLVASIQKDILRQTKKLDAAKKSLAQAKNTKFTSRSEAAQNTYARARGTVSEQSAVLRQLREQMRVAKQLLRDAKANAALSEARARIEDRIAAYESRLSERQEADLAATLTKYEAQWRKKREQADRKKLKAYTAAQNEKLPPPSTKVSTGR